MPEIDIDQRQEMIDHCGHMHNESKLYDKNSLEIMRAQSNLSDMSYNRIELIRDLAQDLKFTRIGLANCVMFNREAQVIEDFLSKDFQVFSVNCKVGQLKKNELFEGGGTRTLCNPAGQAEFLNGKETDMNISIGLCVGHDMIFNTNSAAPVTSIFTKDFTNGNNPDKAIQDISR